jgi:hypothetical protein
MYGSVNVRLRVRFEFWKQKSCISNGRQRVSREVNVVIVFIYLQMVRQLFYGWSASQSSLCAH